MRLPAGLEYMTRPLASSTVTMSDACSRSARSRSSLSRKRVSPSVGRRPCSGTLESTAMGRVYGRLLDGGGGPDPFVPFDDRGVGPQTLEVVVPAHLVEEHMDDEVAVVEQHPLGVGEAL